MTYASVCSGIEAASIAWEPLGWRPAWFAEIEPFPSAVLAHRFPQVPNLGDMTKIKGDEHGAIDLLVGGTPCFTAGTMVLTRKGYIPIERIQVGDEVVTHTGELKKTVATGKKTASVGVLRGIGVAEGIECTPEHPFLACDFTRIKTGRGKAYTSKIVTTEPHWNAAQKMPGKQWLSLREFNVASEMLFLDRFTHEQIMYLAGMYIGDGYIRRWEGNNKKALILCLNENKIKRMSKFVNTSDGFTCDKRTSKCFVVCCTELCDWLIKNFGEKSHGKTIPAWCLSAERRDVLFRGIMDTDGYQKNSHSVSLTTTSKSLAYGFASLLNTLGYTSGVYFVKMPNTCVIEGRIVSQRNQYQVKGCELIKSNKARVVNGYISRTVKSFVPTRMATVYNIEVERNHSYVANGVIVHNCQDLSIAGKRMGFAGKRSVLAIDFVRLAYESGARWFVWENVPGVFSSNGGEDFAQLLSLFSGWQVDVPADGWRSFGIVEQSPGCFGLAWRVLDVQYARVDGFQRAIPQRRNRVFIVGYLGDWRRAAKVLFEPEGLLGNTPPRREAGKGTAEGAERCTDDSGEASGLREVARMLRAQSQCSFREDTETLVLDPARPWDETGVNPSLCRGGLGGIGASNQELFSQNCNGLVFDARGNGDGDVCPTVTGDHAGRPTDYTPVVLATGSTVRRLTPVEAERLMGFPDNWTRIPWRGKPAEDCPDGPRYKACGNSMGVNVMRWIGKRIQEVEDNQ